MRHSFRDSVIWKEEFELLNNQSHFDKVWNIVETKLGDFIRLFLDEFSFPVVNHIKSMINEHKSNQDKYTELFNPEVMEEYEDDLDGFKGSVLSRRCPVIQKTLNSKQEALNDWKRAYRYATAEELYDTFYNMIDYAEDYNNKDEQDIEAIEILEDVSFSDMDEAACYLTGVIGTGIMSTVLNAIYPRIFPGRFRVGMFALYILSGGGAIDMKSETSEFIMVKDDMYSKTGIIETEHNYFYPYETFGLFTLKIYRKLNKELYEKYDIAFPNDFRYVLTNNFYSFVCEKNKDSIKTLLGNDDILKYGYI